MKRARREAAYRPFALLDNTGGLFQSAITLTEPGSHNDLVSRGGLYAASWHTQMKTKSRSKARAPRLEVPNQMIRLKPAKHPHSNSQPPLGDDPGVALICKVLRGEPVEWPTRTTPEFEEGFLEASAYHGIIPLLYHELRQTGSWHTVPTNLQERLKAGARRQAGLELARKHEIIQVLGTLVAHGVPTLLLKGGSLAYSHYASPELRARVDTDLLIRKADLPAALEILKDLGDEFPPALSGISSAVSCAGKHHCIDLHWSINNALIFARALSFDELYCRSTPIPSLTNNVRAPGRVDALIIACVHRAAHLPDRSLVNGKLCRYGNRLIWLYDIHLLMKSMSTACWQEFVALTEEKKLSSFCLDAVEIAQRLFHSPVPPSVIDALNVNQTEERIPLGKLRSRTQFFISDFRVTPTWRERLSLLHRRLFPNAAYIRAMYQAKADTPLPLLYLRRALRRFFDLVIERQ